MIEEVLTYPIGIPLLIYKNDLFDIEKVLTRGNNSLLISFTDGTCKYQATSMTEIIAKFVSLNKLKLTKSNDCVITSPSLEITIILSTSPKVLIQNPTSQKLAIKKELYEILTRNGIFSNPKVALIIFVLFLAVTFFMFGFEVAKRVYFGPGVITIHDLLFLIGFVSGASSQLFFILYIIPIRIILKNKHPASCANRILSFLKAHNIGDKLIGAIIGSIITGIVAIIFRYLIIQ